jgi:hypothetical protein
LEKELQDLLDLLRLKLLVDGVKILGFVLPESDLDKWVGMTVFKGLFWLEFKDVLDLFGPHDDTTFEDMSFVFFCVIVTRSQLLRWCWKLGLTFNLAHCDECLGEIVVKFLDEVF